MCIWGRSAWLLCGEGSAAAGQTCRVQAVIPASRKGELVSPSIQLLRLKTWESFWISLSLSPTYKPLQNPVGFIFKIYPESDHFSLPPPLLSFVQATVISCLDHDNNLLTGLPASNLASLVYSQHRSQINLLKIINQNISPLA